MLFLGNLMSHVNTFKHHRGIQMERSTTPRPMLMIGIYFLCNVLFIFLFFYAFICLAMIDVTLIERLDSDFSLNVYFYGALEFSWTLTIFVLFYWYQKRTKRLAFHYKSDGYFKLFIIAMTTLAIIVISISWTYSPIGFFKFPLMTSLDMNFDIDKEVVDMGMSPFAFIYLLLSWLFFSFGVYSSSVFISEIASLPKKIKNNFHVVMYILSIFLIITVATASLLSVSGTWAVYYTITLLLVTIYRFRIRNDLMAMILAFYGGAIYFIVNNPYMINSSL